MNYYLEAFRKFADFKGRARRSEYWYFMLFHMIALVVAIGIDSMIGFPVVYGLYALASLIPNLAVAARRLHDGGRSAWWILISLVPLIGLVLIFFLCQDSVPGENKWGPNPKGFTQSTNHFLITVAKFQSLLTRQNLILKKAPNPFLNL